MQVKSRRTVSTLALLALAAAAAGLAAGCGKAPSIFLTQAQGAQEIRSLSIVILVVSGVIFLFVETLLIVSILRFRKRAEEEAVQTHGNIRLEIIWTAVPAAIVILIFILTVRTMSNVTALPGGDLTVRAVAHQWWWEFRYPQFNFATANELHLPAGKGIKIELETADVIHSFWIPQLGGKTDMVPGTINETTLFDIKPGIYEGKCAEFCGVQHAQMRFYVVAQPAEQFAVWVKGQQAPAPEPTEDPAKAGKQTFLTSPCIACHTVRGTFAVARIGPDLTHLAGRRTLAAGALANTTENLTRWITDPQGVKPGNLMPNFPLTPQQVKQIVAYLESLK